MTTRTNVGSALQAVETNQAELIRRQNNQQQRLDKLEEVADLTAQYINKLTNLITDQQQEITRLTNTLDELYTDLDALTTPST